MKTILLVATVIFVHWARIIAAFFRGRWVTINRYLAPVLLAVLSTSCATIPDPVPTEEGPDNAFIMDPVHGPNW